MQDETKQGYVYFFPSLPNKIEKRAEAEVDFTKWTVNLQVKKKN